MRLDLLLCLAEFHAVGATGLHRLDHNWQRLLVNESGHFLPCFAQCLANSAEPCGLHGLLLHAFVSPVSAGKNAVASHSQLRRQLVRKGHPRLRPNDASYDGSPSRSCLHRGSTLCDAALLVYGGEVLEALRSIGHVATHVVRDLVTPRRNDLVAACLCLRGHAPSGRHRVHDNDHLLSCHGWDFCEMQTTSVCREPDGSSQT
mmetsp:Transcript_20660/g.47221  ORF Transcript_20660/g.47221 Transcript_20660/m.47221 type:complete len:203 (+) Transcript_20660:310-918(+)